MFKRSKNSKKHRPYMYFSLLVPWGGVSALLLWLTNPSRCWTPPLKCRVCGRPPAVLGPALGGSVQPWITDWAHKPVGVATAQRLFSLLWGLLELFQKHLDTYSWAETLLSSSAAPSTLPGRWLTAWCLSHPPDPQLVVWSPAPFSKPRPPEWTGVSAEARGQTGPMRKRLPALPQSLLPTPARQVLQDPRGAVCDTVVSRDSDFIRGRRGHGAVQPGRFQNSSDPVHDAQRRVLGGPAGLQPCCWSSVSSAVSPAARQTDSLPEVWAVCHR
ncbi:uncharacterized protein LOC110258190 isoform X4 [Sus scrofa]|uniref:uncharacterized protein LOC110258190 isoform X4 n=1 Tax=Sus scrofa TaxID=9823 RepID=UPI000A2B2C31|nr:uncharacterized protein LOC110258190 isoform X4 [Sus scrofa]